MVVIFMDAANRSVDKDMHLKCCVRTFCAQVVLTLV